MKHTLLTLLILTAIITNAQNNIFHKINITIAPESAKINVTDSISSKNIDEIIFSLNDKFDVSVLNKSCSISVLQENAKAKSVGMDHDETESHIKTKTWQIKYKGKKPDYFVVKYSGIVDSVLSQSKTNYQRGFTYSDGIISRKGVYLAGSTYWIPTFDGKLSTFKLTANLPKSWKTVSQGKRIASKDVNNYHTDVWLCDKPQEEIFVISAKFTEYSHKMANGTQAMAFLRTPDENIAGKYLDVTEQYMNMYESMITKYPYSKFALVENFWETGYGMPSFTLLGEKIIRFPFILHSSYPHELLHNWWGNSVYVDFDKGNWCEGITAYMADHLIKEQHGQGEIYRRETLQKFTNMVNNENDFPLSEFLSRNDGASEAIGYGKSLMMWHMLRRKTGDKLFLDSWRNFYKNNAYKQASFDDIRKAFEQTNKQDFSGFFKQWVNRKSAPEIKLANPHFDKYNKQYRLFFTLKQTQNEPAFNVDIPVAVLTSKGLQNFVFNMKNKQQDYQLFLNDKPLKIQIDPQFDVFRKLDPNEVPPALSGIWGASNNIIILPAKSENYQLYKDFANKWKELNNGNFTIIDDNKLTELPNNKTAWVLGTENKFTNTINSLIAKYNSFVRKDSVKLQTKTFSTTDRDFIFTFAQENNPEQQSIFISIGNEKAVPGLIRKLPHYGKYGFLAFKGDEPSNIAKGFWPVINSPMVYVFDKKFADSKMQTKRNALAEIKPVFSAKEMMKTVKYLSSDENKGRGLGTPELDKVADYIAGKFKQYGLKPYENNSYFQEFEHKFSGKGTMKLKNVIGIIEGTDKNLKNEVVVISAHYDHLGLGWPDVHKGDEGKIHHGADDNASGVAILLELAKHSAKKLKPKRTIVFVAFTGEEAGLIGSEYFVNHSKYKFFANINIDTDGSLFDKKLMVLNANTAREWRFIFMGTDYTTGVKTQIISQELDASDQFSFIKKGIPAVQLFTGATLNYHKPSDTYDKIDADGMVKVCMVANEVMEYLANREEAMPFTGKNAQTSKTKHSPKTARKVSTGTVPDFAYEGKGVRIASVIPASPAEKAGLKEGDIISGINGKSIETLKEYSDLLKQHKPGDKIEMDILRNGKKQKVKLILTAR